MPASTRSQPQASQASAPLKRKATETAPAAPDRKATRTSSRTTAAVPAPDATELASNGGESEDESDAEVAQFLTPGRSRRASSLSDSRAAGPDDAGDDDEMDELREAGRDDAPLDGAEDEPGLLSDGTAEARLERAAPSREPSMSDSEAVTIPQPKRKRKEAKITYSSKSKAKACEAAETGPPPLRHGSNAHSALSGEDWEAEFADEFEEGDLAPNDGPEAAASARKAIVAADDARQRKERDQSSEVGSDDEADESELDTDSESSDESDVDDEDPRERLNHSPDMAAVLFLRWDKSNRAARFWLAPEEYWEGVRLKASGKKAKLPQRDSRSQAVAAIKKYRSTIVDDEDFRKADFVVLPPGRPWEDMAHFFHRAKQHMTPIITSLYIAEAVRDVRMAKRGKEITTLCDYRDYVINFVPRRSAPRHPYTTEEKLEFGKTLRQHGSAAYGIMAEKYPHHSKESWRNHHQTVNTAELELLVNAINLARKKASTSRREAEREEADELDDDSEDEEELELMLKRQRGASRFASQEAADADSDDAAGSGVA